jgi:hypothetical protein
MLSPPTAPERPRLEREEAVEAGSPAAAPVWTPPIDGHGVFKSLMGRLPKRVRRSFDHEQLLAIRQAAEEMAWGEHPIDIRLSLPLPRGRCYLVLVGGKERRAGRRLAGDRRRHPLVRTGNIVSMLVFCCMLLGLAGFLWLALGLRLG